MSDLERLTEGARAQIIKNQGNKSFLEKHFGIGNIDLYRIKEDGSYEYITTIKGEINNGRDALQEN